MPGTLCFMACHNFHEEVAAAIEAEAWPDVVAVPFPARCGRPPLSWEELSALLPQDCRRLIVFGHACLPALQEPPAGFPLVQQVRLEQCFHLVAPPALVDDALHGNAYLCTPGWLAHWPERLSALGLTGDGAADFFKDFAREVLLLDTGLRPEAPARLAEFQATLGLPTRRLAMGLDCVRQRLALLVLAWRLEQEKQDTREVARNLARRHAGELAQHVAALDFLPRLTRAATELEAIADIEDLFRMLFAPTALHYLRIEQGMPLPDTSLPAPLGDTLAALEADYEWTADGAGFLLRLGPPGQALGKMAVLGLAFPQQRERYLNMALAITGVCALAIENARNRKRLVEAEKMASLGMLVAGVAHEINTPLGVSMTAASALRERSGNLARRFAARSMTQSDLSGYLEQAEQATTLLRGNLERIGRLVDDFRQVAVKGRTPVRRRFHLKPLMEEVVQSMGLLLAEKRIEVLIHCEPSLEIESYPEDWGTILTNLLGNSLKHGFKNREGGAVTMTMCIDADRLHMDYRDDGAGMPPDVLAHIFDPFFTTDLQHGMGLGMHLVYNLVSQRLGGTVDCNSEPGKGIHCRIEVPL